LIWLWAAWVWVWVIKIQAPLLFNWRILSTQSLTWNLFCCYFYFKLSLPNIQFYHHIVISFPSYYLSPIFFHNICWLWFTGFPKELPIFCEFTWTQQIYFSRKTYVLPMISCISFLKPIRTTSDENSQVLMTSLGL